MIKIQKLIGCSVLLPPERACLHNQLNIQHFLLQPYFAKCHTYVRYLEITALFISSSMKLIGLILNSMKITQLFCKFLLPYYSSTFQNYFYKTKTMKGFRK
uniref:Uncharacterized protein n=1 Tax=Opuntia streptacantha TaxID=393608 RepID=A0A7C8ZIL1_OPUST